MLVLVIGALALISVITLVYATIGQGDRRSGASSVRKANTADTVDAIAKHIKGVIADELFHHGAERPERDAAHPGPHRGGLPVHGSVPDLGRAGRSHRSELRAPLRPDRQLQRGPDRYARPARAVHAVPFGECPDEHHAAGLSGQFDESTRFHDWLHISNLSPDGRFVNLWNLARWSTVPTALFG